MKRNSSILLIIAMCLVLAVAFVFVACDKDKPQQDQHEHAWESEWSSNATNHWHACSGCDETKDSAAHIYDNDHDATCNVCGYVRSLEDHVADAWGSDATHHWQACAHEGCELTYNLAEHVFDNDQDPTCNICGYERAVQHEHVWAGDWSKDEANHWYACSGCEETKDLAAHVFDNDHDATCNTCGYERDLGDHAPDEWQHDNDTHWRSCAHEGCELLFDVSEHEFADDHDTLCDVCDYERMIDADHYASDEWSADDSAHWHACMHEGCEIESDRNPHMMQSVWFADETGHWHECSVCEYHKDFAEHVYDGDSDLECNICGFERAPLHVHSWSEDWSKDATNHWYACLGCDETKDLAAHEYDNDQDATCNVCGYERTVQHVHTPDEHGFCSDCGDYLGETLSISSDLGEHRLGLGTLEAGTHYYRLHNIVSSTFRVISTNLPEGSYAFYTIRADNRQWRSWGSEPFDMGPNNNTYDDGYVVITLTTQVTDAYIIYTYPRG